MFKELTNLFKEEITKGKALYHKQPKAIKGLILLGGAAATIIVAKKTITLTSKWKEQGKLSSRKNYM